MKFNDFLVNENRTSNFLRNSSIWSKLTRDITVQYYDYIVIKSEYSPYFTVIISISKL